MALRRVFATPSTLLFARGPAAVAYLTPVMFMRTHGKSPAGGVDNKASSSADNSTDQYYGEDDVKHRFGHETAAAFSADGQEQTSAAAQINLKKSSGGADQKDGEFHEPTKEELGYDHARQPNPNFWFDSVSESASFSSSYSTDAASGKPSHSHDYHRVRKHNDKIVEEERSSGPTAYPKKIERFVPTSADGSNKKIGRGSAKKSGGNTAKKADSDSDSLPVG